MNRRLLLLAILLLAVGCNSTEIVPEPADPGEILLSIRFGKQVRTELAEPTMEPDEGWESLTFNDSQFLVHKERALKIGANQIHRFELGSNEESEYVTLYLTEGAGEELRVLSAEAIENHWDYVFTYVKDELVITSMLVYPLDSNCLVCRTARGSEQMEQFRSQLETHLVAQ